MDIRRFFQPTAAKPAAAPHGDNNTDQKKKKKKKSLSSDEDVKNKNKQSAKVKNSKSDEKQKDGDKKRKKHGVIESDSEDEAMTRKSKKSPKEKPKKANETETPPKKDPVQYVSETDSDSDNFQSLKKVSKPKQNGTAKPTKSEAESARPGTKGGVKSPVSTQKKPAVKSPITPKSAPPPQPKKTPTSVMDYFGSATIHRSDKKLVASTKRKAPVHDAEDLISDEQIARELQMDEDMELEKQVHEDEEFARTLAMLDEEPQAKKARKGSDEKPSPAAGSTSSPSKTRQRKSDVSEDVISPSPKKNPVPAKTSSKLAMMKKRDEEKDAGPKSKTPASPVKMQISPKKEKLTPKTGATPSSVKTSPKKPESTSTSPDDAEKRKVNASAYRNFLNRDGPRALGSKEIPQGAENCLEGCMFVVTGVLESMERDDAKSLIERYGGKVTGNISKKTTYLVQGRDGGVSKLEKAESFGTTILDEDGLLELIRTKPGKKSKYEIVAEAEAKASKTRTPPSKKNTPKSQKISPSKGNSRSPQTPSPSKTGLAQGHATRTKHGGTPPGRGSGHTARRDLGLSSSTSSSAPAGPPSSSGEGASLLWVDKYRPRSLKTVIGQQGEQSCANKLLRWLQSWHKHHGGGASKPPAARFGKFGGGKDDGSGFKAALLSGPPGVGKTTTAALVCEELGFSFVEMNASCTRSRNNLKEVVAESLNNTSIENFYKGTSQTVTSKHVLIMDEVDGMAGNEDRGGIQEMIGLIKNSKIPIICMCNDRNHQKIRSLANYCFDLRFQRPRVEQIKGAMMSLAFKEGIKIPPPALNEIILASNQDVRQVIHNLSMWSARDKVMTYDQCKSDAARARKDMKMGPFDVCRKVFAAGEETAHMSLIDKSDLFFHDYSLAPLFVQENYLQVRPKAASGDPKSHLVLLSKTADSISDGDLVDRRIRSGQNWSLLPTQAIYASVLPGELMRGYMSHFPTFPSWLGKNSSTSKHSRIVQELSSHMCLKTMSSRQAVNLDYLYYLRQALLSPLQRHGAEGAAEAVQLLDDYQLIKEDVDSIMEISVWGGQPDPYSKLDSKVKAAFTRTYNKEVHLTPYSLQVVKKGRRGGGGGGGESELGGEDVDERTATVMEEDALNQPTAAEADLSLHRLSESPCGSLVVYVIPESSSLLPEDVDVYIGQRRTAMLRMGAPMRVGKTLEQLLSHLEPRIKQVLQVMSFSHNDITAALSDRVRLSPGNKESVADSMRAFKSSPGYEITFSLLNPDPKSHRLHWDIESAVQTYIQPLLTKLAPLANFSIDSQTLYYTMLGVNPRFDSSRSIYMLNADSLAHVINPVEARLGSNAASSNPVLNFLLYVPDAHHSPLHIHDHKKQEVPSNAFHSPRWGGIMVYNVDGFYGPEAAFPVDININMAKVMGVFLAQLRLLLGVQSSSPPPGFRVAPCSSAGLADWELDRLMWSRSVENVATATTTITSLAQLLDQIGNIVINDNIAQQVSSAVTSLQLAVAELEAGNLGFALQYSKEAILASERAFFDPSLLHLLYFPDDQKFAIYIPLFLPMCVPILLSLLKIMSEARQRRREKTKKKD